MSPRWRGYCTWVFALGKVVLDLGSGGGFDVLLTACKVAPKDQAYGLDTTTEVHELAQRNQADAGVTHAEFVLDTIENTPLSDGRDTGGAQA